jgi:hypothetical protein
VKPRRIQRKRVKGWRLPPNTVCCSRPSKWGNPYQLAHCGIPGTCDRWVVVHKETLLTECMPREDAVKWAIRRFEMALKLRLLRVTPQQVRDELHGKDLACWCPLGSPCHVDVLLEIANG